MQAHTDQQATMNLPDELLIDIVKQVFANSSHDLLALSACSKSMKRIIRSGDCWKKYHAAVLKLKAYIFAGAELDRGLSCPTCSEKNCIWCLRPILGPIVNRCVCGNCLYRFTYTSKENSV